MVPWWVQVLPWNMRELVSSKYPSKGRLESRLLSTIHIKKIYKDKPFFTSDIDMGEKLRVS